MSRYVLLDRRDRLASLGPITPFARVAILSIQSQVLNGSVGNTGAAFIYARLGFEVWALPTVLLSHHPGHGGAQGGPVAPPHLMALVTGLAARGAFARCEAVVSGYLGAAGAVPAVIAAVSQARAAHPGALYVCDPVIGDGGRVYVPAELIAAFREDLLPLADIALPNPFELSILTGRSLPDRAAAFDAMARLGPAIVVLTGFAGADTAPATLDILLLAAGHRHLVTVERIDGMFSGAGDAFAALFVAGLRSGRDAVLALATASRAIDALLRATAQAGAAELCVVEQQDVWARIHHEIGPGQSCRRL